MHYPSWKAVAKPVLSFLQCGFSLVQFGWYGKRCVHFNLCSQALSPQKIYLCVTLCGKDAKKDTEKIDVRPGGACQAIHFKRKSQMSCFIRQHRAGWQHPLGDVCLQGNVDRLKGSSASDETGGTPQSMACYPSPSSPSWFLHLHNINRSMKESQIISVFISFTSRCCFILQRRSMSWPSHCIFLCSEAQICCAISLSDAQIGIWSFSS